MHRSPIALALVACLTLAGTGCGSGSSTTSTVPTSSASSPGSSLNSTATGTPNAGRIRSIFNYGSRARGAEKAAASTAALSFFAALAARDYPRICAGLSAGNRAQTQAFFKLKHLQGKGCAGVLQKLLLSSQIPTLAQKAARGMVSTVRVRGDTAFVLFRPAGGPPSFFVMKREQGAWKATSVVPGLQLKATAP